VPVKIPSWPFQNLLLLALFAAAPIWLGLAEVEAQGKRSWSAPPEAKKLNNPVSNSSAAIQDGGKIFRQYCVDCHGPKGDGNGGMAGSLKRKPANLTRSQTRALADGEIFWRISKGDDVMPSFEKTFPLSETERWQLVLFVKNLGSKK
jgi:mono/diheme cytochrome c family protein